MPPGEDNVKVPAWLNDLTLYHNRGNTTSTGESSDMGDFGGLDDLLTENPRVVQGFIDIYGDWIDRYGVRGVLPMAALARQQDFTRVFTPPSDAAEAALIPGLEVYPAASLAALVAHLSGLEQIPPHPPITPESVPVSVLTDFSEIKGQEHVKRALEVAAAGGHNMLMSGPPGFTNSSAQRAKKVSKPEGIV